MKKVKERKNNLLFFSKELKKYRNRRIRKSVGTNFSDAVICRLSDVKNIAASVLIISALSAVSAYALPQGGNVVAGSASISTSGSTTMLINQATNRAIVDWNKFNINANELVKFMQPGKASVILNKVIGTDPSSILGALQANGRVFLVNPNGIVFGQNVAVDVAGLAAITFDIKNSDFMNGNYTFNQDTNKNLSYIINKGTIKISDNGFVFLVAPSVSNEGLIVANLGKAVLGSGKGLTVDFFGDGTITYSVTGKVLERSKDLTVSRWQLQ